MKSKVKLKHQPKGAIKELKKISASMRGPNSVRVGLPKGSNPYPDGTSVIMVGAVHEFGSPTNNVPQRSFLRSTVVDERESYKTMFIKLSKRIVGGTINKVEALGLVGLQVQTDVRKKITDIKEPNLKIREGNPLVDTGHLRQSIIFEVDN